MYTVYVCAGGTGGHVFPAIAVFEKITLSKKFITDERGMRFTADGVRASEIVLLRTIRFRITNIFSAVRNIFLTLLCFMRNRPSVIICFGGIITLIPGIMAKFFGARVVIHEQNAVMGRANRLLRHFADDILLSYEGTKYGDGGEYVGMPVRSSIKPAEYRTSDVLTISVIGGSQGANFFSDLMTEVLANLDPNDIKRIKVYHQAKREDIKRLTFLYKSYNADAVVKKFFPDMSKLYAVTNLIIARAGSATLSELTVTKIPAILVPLKNSMDNHQYENARRYADYGACILIEESDSCARRVSDLIHDFLKDLQTLVKYHENFNAIKSVKCGERILELVNEFGQK